MLRNVEHSKQEIAPSATLSLNVDTCSGSGHPRGHHHHLVTCVGPCVSGTVPGVGGGDVSGNSAQRPGLWKHGQMVLSSALVYTPLHDSSLDGNEPNGNSNLLFRENAGNNMHIYRAGLLQVVK